ncbi:MAG: DnaD domain protein [Tyzzerella sp.]|nr:DnaD domain protein [Tyzzerella sp.]
MTRTLTLRNRFQGNSTIVENEFIDFYMAKANGEYVKVYLLLLRYLNADDHSMSISRMADCLECTEKDILRAFNYWHEAGLLKLDYDEAGNICGLAIGKASVKPAVQAKNKESSITLQSMEMDKPAERRVNSQEELRQLYFVAEQYMGKPLTVNEIKKINYFLDELNFSTDLIEYLIEYCVENGHKSMRYIEKVAYNWADMNVTCVADAKDISASYNKTYFSILNAFGIKGRNPAALEMEFMKRWFDEYGFSLDIILEACNRTIANTHKADFKYTDTILKNWLNQNVHHLSDVSNLDKAYQLEKESKKKTKAKPVTNNRFNNFEGRSYDYDLLEQQLLNAD